MWLGLAQGLQRLAEGDAVGFLEATHNLGGPLPTEYHNAQDVRDALAISSDVPVVSCDARNRESTKNVLISLVEYVLTMRRTRAVAPA